MAKDDLPSCFWTPKVGIDLLGDKLPKRVPFNDVLTRRRATRAFVLAEPPSQFHRDLIDTLRSRHAPIFAAPCASRQQLHEYRTTPAPIGSYGLVVTPAYRAGSWGWRPDHALVDRTGHESENKPND